MTGDGDTHAGEPGAQPPGQRSWVGRARVSPPPPPAVDPYWPPMSVPTAGYPVAVTGPPLPRRRSGRSVALILAGVVAACCAGSATLFLLSSALIKDALGVTSPVTGGSAPDAPADDDDAPANDPAPKPPGLNTPVRDGTFEFVVSSVSCGHAKVGGSVVNTRARGQFCVVSLTVANIGSEPQTFTDFFQKALDPDGTVYGADSGAGIIANEGPEVVWKVINPGNSIAGKIVYDIPGDGQIAALELHDSILSNGVTVYVPRPASSITK